MKRFCRPAAVWRFGPWADAAGWSLVQHAERAEPAGPRRRRWWVEAERRASRGGRCCSSPSSGFHFPVCCFLHGAAASVCGGGTPPWRSEVVSAAFSTFPSASSLSAEELLVLLEDEGLLGWGWTQAAGDTGQRPGLVFIHRSRQLQQRSSRDAVEVNSR